MQCPVPMTVSFCDGVADVNSISREIFGYYKGSHILYTLETYLSLSSHVRYKKGATYRKEVPTTHGVAAQ